MLSVASTVIREPYAVRPDRDAFLWLKVGHDNVEVGFHGKGPHPIFQHGGIFGEVLDFGNAPDYGHPVGDSVDISENAPTLFTCAPHSGCLFEFLRYHVTLI